MQVGEGQQVQIVQAQPQGQSQQAQSGTGQTMQVMQQIITNTGEIQQIPVSRCGAGSEVNAAASAWGCVCLCAFRAVQGGLGCARFLRRERKGAGCDMKGEINSGRAVPAPLLPMGGIALIGGRTESTSCIN